MKTTSTFKYLYQIGLVTIIMLFSLVALTIYNFLPKNQSNRLKKVEIVDTVHQKMVIYDTIIQKIAKVPKVTQQTTLPEPTVETTPTNLDTTK